MPRFIEVERLGANVTVVTNPRARVWFSYTTPVAVLILTSGRKVRRPNGFYSRTTAKHLGIYCPDFEVLNTTDFEKVLEEVA